MTWITGDEAKRLLKAATPGPWEISVEIDGVYAGKHTVIKACGTRIVTVDQTRPHHWNAAEANIALCAAAPLLARAVKDLEHEVNQLRIELAASLDREAKRAISVPAMWLYNIRAINNQVQTNQPVIDKQIETDQICVCSKTRSTCKCDHFISVEWAYKCISESQFTNTQLPQHFAFTGTQRLELVLTDRQICSRDHKIMINNCQWVQDGHAYDCVICNGGPCLNIHNID